VRRAIIALVAVSALAVPALRAQVRTQRVTFRTVDGAVLSGSYYEASPKPSPAVILVHMYTRNRRDWEPVAARLSAEGIAALTFDLRGHGESTPAPTEAGAAPVAMIKDLDAANQFLGSRSDVAHDRIGIAGASLGANLAVQAAAANPAIRSLVLLSPTLDYRGVRIEQAARKINRPMLLVASREDAYAWRTVRELTNPKQKESASRETLLLDQAGHGTGMFARDSSVVQSIVEFFRRTL
jgi:alpha-beta hydrolase superfamily lysophospholipase